MLEGEVDVVADGDRYTLRPGDVFWTGVGCIHAFYETKGGTVKWLETSAPGPPDRHSYRFERDWEYLAERLRDGRRMSAKAARRPGALDRDLYLDLYRRMRLIRGFEDLVQSLFLRNEVYGTTHLYSGQEAIAVGFASALDGSRPRRRDLPRARPRARARRRPAEAPRRDARPRDRDQRRPRRLDERHVARRPADRLASGSSAAASPRRPARRSRSGARAASRSRTSATARRTRATSSSASTSARCRASRSCSSARTTATASTRLRGGDRRRDPRARRGDGGAGRDDRRHERLGDARRGGSARSSTRARAAGPYFVEAITYRFVGHSRSDPGKYRPAGRARPLARARPARRAARAARGRGRRAGRARRDRRLGRRTSSSDAESAGLAAPFPEPRAFAEFKERA